MKELSRVFTEKERQRLRLLLLILGLSLVFLFLVSLRERRSFHRLEGALAGRKTEFAKIDLERATASIERDRWAQAEKDLGELKAKYFYQEKDGANALRLDLQQIFAESGISARTLKFDYVDLERENARKVSVTFNFTGTYPTLKRFLETVEQFPRFLCLERLDFVRITGGGNTLELRAVLAGYYAYL
jgi:Tfp pilus assembly protein PilO